MVAPTAMAAPHLKSELRRVSPPHDPASDPAIRARLASHLLDPDACVAFVWPMSGEPDLRPLMRELEQAGRRLALPAVIAPHQPLAFHPWRATTPLVAGLHGTHHPQPALGEPALHPDIILVPLIAFDRRRNRLGRGGGYFDRTLAAYPQARAIGFAHSAAELRLVPTEPHDRPLDLIVTERESF